MERNKRRPMVKFKKIVTFAISAILISSLSISSYALPDVSHSYYEEDKLLDTNWYIGKCIDKSPTCQKHILRYESVDDFIKYLEKNLKDTNSKKLVILLKRYSGTIALTAAGSAATAIVIKLILSCKNLHALMALVAAGGAIYITQPVRNFLSYIFGSIPQAIEFLKNKLLNKDLTPDEEGLLTNLINILLGNKDASFSALDLGKEIYNEMLYSLKQKIANKEYLDNDILIVSWDNDQESPSFSIKFDTANYAINYDKSKNEFFK